MRGSTASSEVSTRRSRSSATRYRADEAHAGSKLPGDLGAALDALEADTRLVDALGAELVATFVAMKRFEVERFAEAVGELDVNVVTEWELEEYAAHL